MTTDERKLLIKTAGLVSAISSLQLAQARLWLRGSRHAEELKQTLIALPDCEEKKDFEETVRLYELIRDGVSRAESGFDQFEALIEKVKSDLPPES